MFNVIILLVAAAANACFVSFAFGLCGHHFFSFHLTLFPLPPALQQLGSLAAALEKQAKTPIKDAECAALPAKAANPSKTGALVRTPIEAAKVVKFLKSLAASTGFSPRLPVVAINGNLFIMLSQVSIARRTFSSVPCI